MDSTPIERATRDDESAADSAAVPENPAVLEGAAVSEDGTLADGRFHRLDPGFVVWRRRRAYFRTVILSLLIAVGGALLVGTLNLQLMAVLAGWVLLTGLLLWLGHSWPLLAYRYSSYRVMERGIEVRRGVLARSMIHVPRSRIQHTDVSQGPLERSLDLATLTIYTAGQSYAAVPVAGLRHDLALRIRAFLIEAAQGDDV